MLRVNALSAHNFQQLTAEPVTPDAADHRYLCAEPRCRYSLVSPFSAGRQGKILPEQRLPCLRRTLRAHNHIHI
ncbi:hypothetical protein D3C80_1877130 [compost metagenome]